MCENKIEILSILGGAVQGRGRQAQDWQRERRIYYLLCRFTPDPVGLAQPFPRRTRLWGTGRAVFVAFFKKIRKQTHNALNNQFFSCFGVVLKKNKCTLNVYTWR